MSKFLSVAGSSRVPGGSGDRRGSGQGRVDGLRSPTRTVARTERTGEHTAACVEKCMKGGSKAQLYVDSEKKSYALNDFTKVKALVGQKVTVKGSLASDGTITIDSAAKAAS